MKTRSELVLDFMFAIVESGIYDPEVVYQRACHLADEYLSKSV